MNKNFDNSLINEFVKKKKFIKRVVELDRSQPEFKLTLKQYLDKVVNKTRIKKAKKLLKKIKHYCLKFHIIIKYNRDLLLLLLGD